MSLTMTHYPTFDFADPLFVFTILVAGGCTLLTTYCYFGPEVPQPRPQFVANDQPVVSYKKQHDDSDFIGDWEIVPNQNGAFFNHLSENCEMHISNAKQRIPTKTVLCQDITNNRYSQEELNEMPDTMELLQGNIRFDSLYENYGFSGNCCLSSFLDPDFNLDDVTRVVLLSGQQFSHDMPGYANASTVGLQVVEKDVHVTTPEMNDKGDGVERDFYLQRGDIKVAAERYDGRIIECFLRCTTISDSRTEEARPNWRPW